MDHFFTRNSMGRVFGFLEVNSVQKNWKIYPNFKILEIFGFLDLGLSLEPDTWLYLFGHEISQTQPVWGHTQNFSSFGPLILHLPGGAESAPPPSLKCGAGTPSLLGLTVLYFLSCLTWIVGLEEPKLFTWFIVSIIIFNGGWIRLMWDYKVFIQHIRAAFLRLLCAT